MPQASSGWATRLLKEHAVSSVYRSHEGAMNRLGNPRNVAGLTVYAGCRGMSIEPSLVDDPAASHRRLIPLSTFYGDILLRAEHVAGNANLNGWENSTSGECHSPRARASCVCADDDQLMTKLTEPPPVDGHHSVVG
jgi:hypothetical protein